MRLVSWGLGKQTYLARLHNGLCPVGYVKLTVDMAGVGLYGSYGDDKRRGDFLVGEAGGNKLQHLEFSRRQMLD